MTDLTTSNKLSCPITVEFNRVDPVRPKADCAERVSNIFLYPLRLACGREVRVEIVKGNPNFENEKQLCLIGKIFMGLLALIILPITLMGLALAACSKSRQEMFKKYSLGNAQPTPPASPQPSSGGQSPAPESNETSVLLDKVFTQMDAQHAMYLEQQRRQDIINQNTRLLTAAADGGNLSEVQRLTGLLPKQNVGFAILHSRIRSPEVLEYFCANKFITEVEKREHLEMAREAIELGLWD